MKDYYKILEIEYGASLQDIKRVYRKLAFKYHPDKNKAPDAASKFIEITEAYEVLCDSIKRKEYDNLYRAHFKKGATNNQTNTNNKSHTSNNSNASYEQKQRQWESYGREKAKEYSSTSFNEFASKVFKEVRIGINYIPNLIAMILVIVFGISCIYFTFSLSDTSALFLLLPAIGSFYLAYRLYLIAIADYKKC